MLGKKELDGSFITKPTDIGRYYFNDMPTTTYEPTPQCVTDQIMKNKHCNFELSNVSEEEVKNVLLSANNDKPLGSDTLEGQLMRMIVDYNIIATPICHLFNLNLQVSMRPQAWREENVIPNNSKVHFTGSNS
jgi:NRPS condensation-like uncharacterized protein